MQRPAFLLLAIALSLTLPPRAQAQARVTCAGQAPDWDLTLSDATAEFTYDGRSTAFEIPHSTAAEGRDWPRAYSLIADFDTAIVIVDTAACQGGDARFSHLAQVLTQRGQTPILLSGCCEVTQ